MCSRLHEWRSDIQAEVRAAWKELIIRVSVIGAAIGILLGLHAVARKQAYRHIHDLDTCQVLLMGERVLLWLIIIVIVVFAFAFDMTSLATFLGLLSAGLAVGLHDMLLALRRVRTNRSKVPCAGW